MSLTIFSVSTGQANNVLVSPGYCEEKTNCDQYRSFYLLDNVFEDMTGLLFATRL